nr:hypothetical protein [Tanacetum cinerariifolium]
MAPRAAYSASLTVSTGQCFAVFATKADVAGPLLGHVEMGQTLAAGAVNGHAFAGERFAVVRADEAVGLFEGSFDHRGLVLAGREVVHVLARLLGGSMRPVVALVIGVGKVNTAIGGHPHVVGAIEA